MEILVYNESEDAFRSGKVTVLSKDGLASCAVEPCEDAHQGKQLLVVCFKDKKWPDDLKPYVAKVKAELRAETDPNQVEIKTILFQPREDRWACDVYVRGVRRFCGKGHQLKRDAISEASAWVIANATKIENEVQE